MFRALTVNLYACLQQHTEELATIESLDNGKPYDIAKSVDVPMVMPCILPYNDCQVVGQCF